MLLAIEFHDWTQCFCHRKERDNDTDETISCQIYSIQLYSTSAVINIHRDADDISITPELLKHFALYENQYSLQVFN